MLTSPRASVIEQLERRCLLSAYTLIDLGTLGGNIANANDISEAGEIVGSATTASGQTHAFLWQIGVMTDLGTLGGAYGAASGLYDNGQVVGFSRVSDAKPWNRLLVTPSSQRKAQRRSAELGGTGSAVKAPTI